MPKHFTMIGSRETPDVALANLRSIATHFGNAGWTGRSGGADGADTCLENAVIEKMEIFLPWADFNYRKADGDVYINTATTPCVGDAYEIASELHPVWHKITRGAKKLHARNVFQILGRDLKTPSDCVICYAKPVGDKGHVKGGTATAVKLALENNIPVFNLYHEDGYDRALEFLKGVES